jgi:hypothetical protein
MKSKDDILLEQAYTTILLKENEIPASAEDNTGGSIQYIPHDMRKQMIQKVLEVLKDPTIETEDLQFIYDHLVGDEE